MSAKTQALLGPVSTSIDPAASAVHAPTIHVYPEDRLVTSRMRRSIADHMVYRAVSAPQSIWDCDWTQVWKAYRKPDYAARGVRLTITAFLVEAGRRRYALFLLSTVPMMGTTSCIVVVCRGCSRYTRDSLSRSSSTQMS